MTLVVNGIPIFAKGANLIPFDSIPSRVTEATIRRTLQDAHTANMNMLRVWGGGHYQDEHFYALADALGIMIWQDFMFGGAIPRRRGLPRKRPPRSHRTTHPTPRPPQHCPVVRQQRSTDRLGTLGRPHHLQTIPAPEERSKIERGITTLFGSVLREAVHLYSPSTPYWATSPAPTSTAQQTKPTTATCTTGKSGATPHSQSPNTSISPRASCPNMACNPFRIYAPSAHSPAQKTSPSHPK